MSNKKSVIVVRVPLNHPTGCRRRAGFAFTQEAQAVEVTSEQKKEILEDKYLIQNTKGLAFKEAMAKFNGKDNKDGGDGVDVAAVTAKIEAATTDEELDGIEDSDDFNYENVKLKPIMEKKRLALAETHILGEIAKAGTHEKLDEFNYDNYKEAIDSRRAELDDNDEDEKETLEEIKAAETNEALDEIENAEDFDAENEKIQEAMKEKREELKPEDDENEGGGEGGDLLGDDDEEEEGKEGEETQLVAALEAKGKKSGEDFEPEAKNEALRDLLKSLN